MRFRQWTTPATGNQVAGTLAGLKRSKRELIAENIIDDLASRWVVHRGGPAPRMMSGLPNKVEKTRRMTKNHTF
jgi:hypothetical protein